MKTKEELEARVTALKQALLGEWEQNHSEMCTNVPHVEGEHLSLASSVCAEG